MNRTREPMHFLLISRCPLRAALIEQQFRAAGAAARVRRMDPGANALACARHSGPYRSEPAPDAVMLDVAEPDDEIAGLLTGLAGRDAGAAPPVILLTTPGSEGRLCQAPFKLDTSRIFAPTDLTCFAANLARRSRARFRRALEVLAGLGPILIRLPVEPNETPALRVAASL